MEKEYIALIIEDEMPLQEAIKIKMSKTGFNVLSARSIQQAKNHLQDLEKIDVIWLDHYLFGGETGLDFLEFVKNSDKYKNIPIFVISNTCCDMKRQTYLRLGAEKFYIKAEFRLEDIIRDIREYLDSK